MWKVEVESAKLNVKSGVSARTGKQYSIREQEAWVYCFDLEGNPHKHPQKARLTLADDQLEPYAPGAYFVHPGSVYLDGKFNQLAIRVRLMPLEAYKVFLRNFYSSVFGSSSGASPVSTVKAA